jgi:hypothetical protein
VVCQKPDGPGVDTSVSLICNFFGTRSESAKAFESAAARVLQTYEGNLDASPDVRSRRHMCDLMSLKELRDSGHLCNLRFKHDAIWDETRKLAHKEKCEGGGGSVAVRNHVMCLHYSWPKP